MENHPSRARKIIGFILIVPAVVIVIIILLAFVFNLFNAGGGEVVIYPAIISIPLFFIGTWVGKYKGFAIIGLIVLILLIIWLLVGRSRIDSTITTPVTSSDASAVTQ